MKRGFFLANLWLVMTLPAMVFASACSTQGFTVVYVNGILTSRESANDQNIELQRRLPDNFKGEKLTVILGHNETHLAGIGDLVQSIAQTYHKSVSNYDRDTILNQIAPDVTTQKILLVGHSQGTFYTNELYKYLVAHGVSKDSIAVYNLATPADAVEGGGLHLTSANDKAIYAIRSVDAEHGAPEPLSANILIPIPPSESEDEWAGHYFTSDYLAGAPIRIVSDISKLLSQLKSHESTDGSCFAPPSLRIAHAVQGAVLAVADPIASVSSPYAQAAGSALAPVGQFAARTLDTLVNEHDWLAKDFAFLLTPQSKETATAAFPIVKALYGSSMSETDLQELTGETPKRVSVPTATKAAPVKDTNTSNVDEHTTSQTKKEEKPAPKTQGTFLESLPSMIQVTPGFGGGGSGATEGSTASTAPGSSSVVVSLLPFAITSPENGYVSATTSVSFAGTTTAGAIVLADYSGNIATTTSDGAGVWSLPLTLPEGSQSVGFSSYTDSLSSGTSTLSLTIDLTPPSAPTIALDACSYSLSSSFCLVATSTAAPSWGSVSGASYYALYSGGLFVSSTTALTLSTSMSDSATSTFQVVAYDAAGNAATSSSLSVRVALQPLTINEIGYGVYSNGADQFVELKNQTPFTLDLSHVSIHRSGDTPIALSGSITPTSGTATDGFLAVEATGFITSSVNKLIASFGALSQTGEKLSLVWNESTFDETPDVATCGGWCAGSSTAEIGTSVEAGYTKSYSPFSMARTSGDGSLSSGWTTSSAYGSSLGSAYFTWGSPGVANNTFPDHGWYCGSGGTPISSGATYIPSSGSCTYLSQFISPSVNRYGGVFSGVVGSSTQLTGHFMSHSSKSSENDSLGSRTSGENLFVLLWQIRSGGNDQADFVSYVTAASTSAATVTSPPHGNYKIIPWVYGP